VRNLTNLSDDAFATMIAAKLLVEDATIHADRFSDGFWRQLGTLPVTVLPPWLRDLVEELFYGDEISWGPANVPLPLAIGNLEWWEQNHSTFGLDFEDLNTYYYGGPDYAGDTENQFELELQLQFELQLNEGAVNHMALAILRASSRVKEYYWRRYLSSGGCESIPRLSAYLISVAVRNYEYPDDFIFELSNWSSGGMPLDWVEALDDTGLALGILLLRGDEVEPGAYYDYLPYTEEEKERLDNIPHY
jgi:hypothetical protein